MRRAIRKHFKLFFKLSAPMRMGQPYIYGEHTHGLIDVCQKAFDDYNKGISSYIIINIPVRHGKSDVISRRFPVWALLNNPRLEIMEGCATGDLAKKMSYASNKCFNKYSKSYGTGNAADFNTASSWLTDKEGGMFASGLGGTVVGSGADICIIDDYYRNRADADSITIRNKVWEGFTNDFLTRLAPVHIVFIVSTRWHEDDLVGRIIEKNDPKNKKYEKNFHKFKLIKYAAQKPDGTFLFPERFSEKYYLGSKATLGTYAWNALGMQEPKPRSGNILKAERVNIVKEIEMKPDMVWHSGIDLAHTDVIGKGDPDYTVMTLASFYKGHIYVKTVLRMRESALTRDRKIKTAMGLFPPGTDLRVEVVGASKDAFLYIRKQFGNILSVKPYKNKIGKMRHATIMEPIFELGNVTIEEGYWNDEWISEFKTFPNGTHDDQIDSLFIAIGKEILRNNYEFFNDKSDDTTQDIEGEVLPVHNEDTENAYLSALDDDDYFDDF
jgi:predicted phage terminase large subunit-like protein